MQFEIRLVPSADADLDYYRTDKQRLILEGITKFLQVDASVETKRREQLRPNRPGTLGTEAGRLPRVLRNPRSRCCQSAGHRAQNTR